MRVRTCRLILCHLLCVTVLIRCPPGSTPDTRTASATSSSATGPSTVYPSSALPWPSTCRTTPCMRAGSKPRQHTQHAGTHPHAVRVGVTCLTGGSPVAAGMAVGAAVVLVCRYSDGCGCRTPGSCYRMPGTAALPASLTSVLLWSCRYFSAADCNTASARDTCSKRCVHSLTVRLARAYRHAALHRHHTAWHAKLQLCSSSTAEGS